MLEIALNNDASTDRLSESKEKGLHLSSVNDHRVFLCSVDPNNAYQTRDPDVASNGRCDDDKEIDGLKSFEDLVSNRKENSVKDMHNDSGGNEEEISSVATTKNDYLVINSNKGSPKEMGKTGELCQAENTNDIEMANSAKEIDPMISKGKSKSSKRRKVVSWRSHCNRQQKNSKGRPPRSEMPHEELLKLREKERKAQQLRRERLKRTEEKTFAMSKGKTKKLGSSQPKEDSAIFKESDEIDSEEKANHICDSMTILSFGGVKNAIAEEELRAEDFGKNRQNAGQETPSHSSLIENFRKPVSTEHDSNKYLKIVEARPVNPKLDYMLALGLQRNTKIEDDAVFPGQSPFEEVSSVSHNDKRFFCTAGDTENVTVLKSDNLNTQPNMQAKKRSMDDVVCEKSEYQCWSEESSDSSDRKNSPESLAKKLRRSNLPKEELEKLREKERMAKRKQRAKNRKMDINEGHYLFEAAENDDKSKDSMDLPRNHHGTSDLENRSENDENSQEGENECSSDDIPQCSQDKESSKQLNIDNEVQLVNGIAGKDMPLKSGDGKKIKFGRFYDRSLLTAEELENLRKREREYQRKRRARLREQKFKALGELPQAKMPSERIPKRERSETETHFLNDSSRKYETRMSKGISRPSLRFLEHNSVSYFENENIDGKADPGRIAERIPERIAGHSPEHIPDRESKSDDSVSSTGCKSDLSMMHAPSFVNHCSNLSQSDYPNHNPHHELEKDVHDVRSYDYYHYSNECHRIAQEPEKGSDKISFVERAESERSPIKNIEDDEEVSYDTVEENKSSFSESEAKGPHPAFEKIYDERTAIMPGSTNRRSPLSEALYASDYKILQENGYDCMKSDSDYDTRFYELPGNSRIYNSSWHNQYRPPSETVNCGDPQNGGYYKDNFLKFHVVVDKRDVNGDVKMTNGDVKSETDSSSNQKWRNWKSGLSDSQLQRRRQSNREAQRRRRLRLRLLQMKCLEQDQINFDEIMYKRFTPNKRLMVNEAIKAFQSSKSKLKNMLEKRQNIFMDAQIEKCKSEIESKGPEDTGPEIVKKNRGCRIKVTPKREIVVPSMGFPVPGDIIAEKAGPVSNRTCFPELQRSPSNDITRFGKRDGTGQTFHQQNDLEQRSPPSYEDHMLLNGEAHSLPSFDDQTPNPSGRKRKQFCPRRLLTEAERRSHESLQPVVIAQ